MMVLSGFDVQKKRSFTAKSASPTFEDHISGVVAFVLAVKEFFPHPVCENVEFFLLLFRCSLHRESVLSPFQAH